MGNEATLSEHLRRELRNGERPSTFNPDPARDGERDHAFRTPVARAAGRWRPKRAHPRSSSKPRRCKREQVKLPLKVLSPEKPIIGKTGREHRLARRQQRRPRQGEWTATTRGLRQHRASKYDSAETQGDPPVVLRKRTPQDKPNQRGMWVGTGGSRRPFIKAWKPGNAGGAEGGPVSGWQLGRHGPDPVWSKP